MKSKSIESGFTLVELLVTILIFSFSISIMLAGLDQGRLAWSTLNKKVESVSNLQDRYSWLSMLFSDATATQFSNEYGEAVPFF
ncbi:type II secretion system protein, partial [Aeromonas salmonicida subsp. salmonicida]|nr:type II secretion system protein [Aeromonas salmonicida subsp. salmonicida]